MEEKMKNDWNFLGKNIFFNHESEERVVAYLIDCFEDISNSRFDRAIERMGKINREIVKTLLIRNNIDFALEDTAHTKIKKVQDFAFQENNQQLKEIVNHYIFPIKNIRNIYEHQDSAIHNLGKNDCIAAFDKLHKLLQKIHNIEIVKEIEIRNYFSLKEKKEVNAIEMSSLINDSNVDILIEKRNIEDWLSRKNEKLKIPMYQRKYSWSEPDLDTLISDIEKRMKDKRDHYFGAIAAKKEENGDIKIIDGQQRLTTSLLLMYAARDLLIEQEVKKEDIYPNILQFVFLENPVMDSKDNKIFEEIQSTKFVYDNYETDSNSIFKKNYDFLKKKIGQISNYKESKIREFVDTYIKQFQLSTISFDSEIYTNQAEIEIFESLNSKGKSLNAYELIRNYIFGLYSKEIYNDDRAISIARGEYKNLIDENLKNKDEEKQGIKFIKSFLFYIRGEEIKMTRELSVFDTFRVEFPRYFNINLNNGIKKNEMSDLIRKISDYLCIYEFIVNRNNRRFTSRFFGEYLGDDNSIIAILNSNFQFKKREIFVPLVFLIYEIVNFDSVNEKNNYELTYENKKSIYKSFEIILHFIVRTSLSSGSSSDSGIRKHIYKKIAKLRDKIKTSDENIDSKINSLSKYLDSFINDDYSKSKWEYFEFRKNIEGNLENDISRTILKMLETKLMNNSKTKEQLIINNETLEHIAPKEWDEWWDEYSRNVGTIEKQEWIEQYKENCDRLGNMLLISKKLNSSVKNSIFSKKQIEYKKLISPLYLNNNDLFDVSKKQEWNFKTIDERTKAFAKYFCENIIKNN